MNIPRLLDGRYQVGDRIGYGSTADVHRGRDIRTDRTVAIKMLRSSVARNPLVRANFAREARTTASLRHPAIVSMYDSGHQEVEGPAGERTRVPFIVMEHIPGRSLRDIVRAGGLTVEASLRHQLGVLAALDHCHRAGVVHRDIKPANVMVRPDGVVKVVDFGISVAFGDPNATLTRRFVGTPSYLSPEQARGETADARSDLYSAGCLLYAMVTGRPPFAGDPISLAYQHVHERPAPAGTGLAELDAVLMTALAKSRADRFQTARAFGQALQSAATDVVDLHLGIFQNDLLTAPATGSHTSMATAGC